MHSAIVVVEMPDAPHDRSVSHKWQSFMAEANSLRTDKPAPLDKQKGVARLGENVWLVNLQENPAALARLVYFAVEFEFPYGILPLGDEPQWLPAGFDPRTN